MGEPGCVPTTAILNESVAGTARYEPWHYP